MSSRASCKSSCQHESQLFQSNLYNPFKRPPFVVFINSVPFCPPQNKAGVSMQICVPKTAVPKTDPQIKLLCDLQLLAKSEWYHYMVLEKWDPELTCLLL